LTQRRGGAEKDFESRVLRDLTQRRGGAEKDFESRVLRDLTQRRGGAEKDFESGGLSRTHDSRLQDSRLLFTPGKRQFSVRCPVGQFPVHDPRCAGVRMLFLLPQAHDVVYVPAVRF